MYFVNIYRVVVGLTYWLMKLAWFGLSDTSAIAESWLLLREKENFLPDLWLHIAFWNLKEFLVILKYRVFSLVNKLNNVSCDLFLLHTNLAAGV